MIDSRMATPNPLALTPEIDDFKRQFEEIASDANALVAPLTDRQFGWKRSPLSWSVGECLDHLNATARVYLPSLDKGIADAIGRGLCGPGPHRYNWIGRLHVYLVQTPRVRAKAPRAIQPPAGRTRREIMAAFRAYQVQYIDRLRQANGLDLARARAASPVATWMPIPLGSAFALMVAHEHRHLWQARRVMVAPGFPEG